MSKTGWARSRIPLVLGLVLSVAEAKAQGASPCLNTQPCIKAISGAEPSAAAQAARPATVNCHGTHGLAVFREPGAVNIIATLASGESVEVLKSGIGI